MIVRFFGSAGVLHTEEIKKTSLTTGGELRQDITWVNDSPVPIQVKSVEIDMTEEGFGYSVIPCDYKIFPRNSLTYPFRLG